MDPDLFELDPDTGGITTGDFTSLLEGLSALSSRQLSSVVSLASELQRSRAVDAADPAALLEHGFERGFDAKGAALAPWLTSGVLVCPGSVLEKSATSHDCTFVHADDSWVWEHPELIVDEVRRVPVRGRSHQRSVSLLGVHEGFSFDVITSQMRTGAHRMVRGRRYTIADGDLVVISERTPAPRAGHR